MIFKMQRSLFTTDDEHQCLVYNEDRSIEFMMPMLPELVEFFGDDSR